MSFSFLSKKDHNDFISNEDFLCFLSKMLSKCVTSCLQRASTYTSIVFPALGTGNFNYPRDVVAKTMYDCVHQFDLSNTSLKDIRFLCYDNDTIRAFEREEMLQLIPNHESLPVVENTNQSSVTFKIYFQSGNDLSVAKTMLDQAISENYKTEKQHDSVIANITQNEADYLKGVENRHAVIMTVDKVNCEVIIKGLVDEVMNAKKDIFDALRKFNHTRHGQAEAGCHYHRKSSVDIDDKGLPTLEEYPEMINVYLETAYKGDSGRTEVEFKDDQGEEYIIVLREMTEYSKKDRSKVDVLQREKLQEKWGEGVNFSNEAGFTILNGTDAEDNSTTDRTIYMCKVLTGVHRQGMKGMRYLPMRPDGTMMNFDSATDDSKPPVQFVIFNDTQAYPQYCIRFRL
ncbi:Hypothetical predicted protein [Mytilus galloprovincialis]|uniref:Macro domain-containing protein n=1 Tax=Mytilus galloprovincialis TaxID=29158 RepID=A0A8B6HDL0_MYTGA|nr:Hypothetical predicted protein [Mytilus galloprovincialis]